ncbi:MAG TPA: heavy metal-binding domain-containing protein [Ignavibacteriales bacterium]|nr:heavy metal-binding domain-containing protein [Ignavibacteriales bacterium]
MKMSVKSIKLAQICLSGALVAFSYGGNLMAQSADSHKDHKMSMQGQMMSMGKEKDKDQSIVRKGIIDLKAIDKNKDGKVFQDQMDWNVISDKPGTCPLCKMTLEEVTLKQAKDNLKKNGFKVK